MNRLNNFCLAIGLLILAPNARAADLFLSKYADGTYLIRLNGKIMPADVQQFSFLAMAIPKEAKASVLLTSRGGQIDGLEIGRIVRARGFKTIALDYCNSMCALIWLASKERALYKGTLIGFHAVGDHCADTTGCENISAPGNALVGAYLNELGFDGRTIRFVTTAAPTSVTWLTPENALPYNINYQLYTIEAKPEPK